SCLLFLAAHRASPPISPLPLHDALPIYPSPPAGALLVAPPTTRTSVPGSIAATGAAITTSPSVTPERTATSPVSSSRTPVCTSRSEEHTSELQSRENLVCRLLLEKKKTR